MTPDYSLEEMGELLSPGTLGLVLPLMPAEFREAFELCVLEGLSIRKAASLLGVHHNTVHYRKRRAFEWIYRYLRGELELSPHVSPGRRKVDWERLPEPKPRGRPTRIQPEVEDRIVEMYECGMTLQAIADQLNREGVPAIGLMWRPSSFRSLLRRRGVERRLRGRYPAPGSYSPGMASRKDYAFLRMRELRSKGGD